MSDTATVVVVEEENASWYTKHEDERWCMNGRCGASLSSMRRAIADAVHAKEVELKEPAPRDLRIGGMKD